MEDHNLQQKRRPIWMWMITIYFLFSAGFTLMSLYLTYTGVIRLNAAQEAYLSSLTSVDYAFTILVALMNLIGAVALFLLHKLAFYMFAIALVANLLITTWHAITKGWVMAIGGAGLVGAVIGWAIMIAVCIYSWRLVQRGVIT